MVLAAWSPGAILFGYNVEWRCPGGLWALYNTCFFQGEEFGLGDGVSLGPAALGGQKPGPRYMCRFDVLLRAVDPAVPCSVGVAVGIPGVVFEPVEVGWRQRRWCTMGYEKNGTYLGEYTAHGRVQNLPF